MPFNLARIFPLALFGILAVLPSAVGSRSVSVQDEFPTASEPLSIPGPDEAAWTVKDLLDEYCRVTDQVFVCDAETMNLLQQSPLGVNTGLDVHPQAVNSVVETLMFEHDFVFTWDRTDLPRLVGVASLRTSARNGLRQTARFVDAEDLDAWADHPARLITTTIMLDAMDVRVLSNSLRIMVTDANTQQIIPVGSAGAVLITGFGTQVHALARTLRRINELARTVDVTPEQIQEELEEDR